jgi:seryl-tRNA synthetase
MEEYNYNYSNMEENQILKNDFSSKVKEYITLDEQIKKLAQLVKERRNRMKELSNEIMEEMAENEIDYVNIRNGVLIYNKKEGFKGLSKKVMINGLTAFFNADEERTQDAMDTIMNTREKVVKTSLKLKRF